MARSGIKIEVIRGKEVAALIPEFAQLRMTVFRESPYLYEGDIAEEFEYLNMYAKSSDSVFVIAKDDGRMIGAATGLPFSETLQSMQDLFVQHHIKIESLFYFGELILLKEYREQKVGQRMYDAFEQAVREMGRYDRISGMEIDNASSEIFFIKQGFIKMPDLVMQHSWKEIGAKEETEHRMIFLMKGL